MRSTAKDCQSRFLLIISYPVKRIFCISNYSWPEKLKESSFLWQSKSHCVFHDCLHSSPHLECLAVSVGSQCAVRNAVKLSALRFPPVCSEDNYSTYFTGLFWGFSDFICVENYGLCLALSEPSIRICYNYCYCWYIVVLLIIIFMLTSVSKICCRGSLFSLDCDFLEGGVSLIYYCPPGIHLVHESTVVK